ncbi:MAG: AAA family ATPase [Bacteroidales bacterium]|nr:AAA family ATPase [Bacteroidales bacterium]
MIERTALSKLQKWSLEKDRKPLILRGARQVGKTTLVNAFAQKFDIYLYLNLELESNRKLFELSDDANVTLQAIFLHKHLVYRKGRVLLFIDEIQNSKRAVSMLRYFYEQCSDVYVIAAGSLMDNLLDLRKISFPVGRVSYMTLRPCSFTEFLVGIGDGFCGQAIKDEIDVLPIHQQLMQRFKEFVLVGGMPAAINYYKEENNIAAVSEIFDALIQAYVDDVEKYASNITAQKTIRTILQRGWYSAAETITFEKFGNSAYRSREMSEAFATISKALLLELVYPTTATRLPAVPDFNRRPKLLWLDCGLVNYACQLQSDVFSANDISDVWRGRIAEQVVAQELIAENFRSNASRCYWRKDNPKSSAEIDFLYTFENMLIPIEVKSGTNAKLKSLHIFMEDSPINIAIRVWANPLKIDDITIPSGKQIRLINIPFYYVGQIDRIVRRYI